MLQDVAFLGLGAMGARMAANLIQAGYKVTVWNRSPAPAQALAVQGASVSETPKQAAEQADVVLSMLTDNQASRSVWLNEKEGAIWGLRPGAIAIECSTLTVDWIRELATEVERHHAKFLEAPILGSRPHAEAKKLVALVGGDAETLETVRDVLSSMCGVIHSIGPIGQGMAMKLAANALFGVQVAALAETLGLLNQSGISTTKAMHFLEQLPIMSLAAKGAGDLMVHQKHEPMFPIHLVEKDFRYVQETASAIKASMPLADATRNVYQDAIAHQYGNDNITGVAQLFV